MDFLPGLENGMSASGRAREGDECPPPCRAREGDGQVRLG